MKKNILANFIGRFWSVISNFLFIPLYIRFLGMEGYSLISFSLVITGLLAVVDSGLTATMSREFASSRNDALQRRRVFYSLETCYLIIMLILILFFLFFSEAIAYKWLNLNTISPDVVVNCLKIIGLGFSFQLLSNFYLGGLFGLERQVTANAYQVGMGIMRNGIVLIPLIYKPDLYIFFAWQSVIVIIYTLLLRRSLVKTAFGSENRASLLKIDPEVIKIVCRFAGGIMLISVIATLNTQMDKLAISKLLPIGKLGLYTLAYSLAQGILLFVNPLGTAVLPRFTSLFTGNRITEASELYNTIFLLSSILVFSVGANLAMNGESLIWIWTGNTSTARDVAPFIPWLTLGMVMLAIQIIPFNVALANAYTRLTALLGLASLLITLPGYWIMTSRMGPGGAAIVWAAVQIIITPVFILIINKKYIRGISSYVLIIKNILYPALISVLIALLFSAVGVHSESRWLMLLWIALSTLVTFAAAAFLLMRNELFTRFKELKL